MDRPVKEGDESQIPVSNGSGFRKGDRIYISDGTAGFWNRVWVWIRRLFNKKYNTFVIKEATSETVTVRRG